MNDNSKTKKCSIKWDEVSQEQKIVWQNEKPTIASNDPDYDKLFPKDEFDVDESRKSKMRLSNRDVYGLCRNEIVFEISDKKARVIFPNKSICLRLTPGELHNLNDNINHATILSDDEVTMDKVEFRGNTMWRVVRLQYHDSFQKWFIASDINKCRQKMRDLKRKQFEVEFFGHTNP